ncbi:amidinotransferase [Clostridium niameyense]|uniref:Amidinotransferase n=1 Tax=Clostridium niameyense TaxID=1622073 RepID=A0A6M0R8B0_9CLOT|nr:arginine deiminase family protein [Clostridium niameyense]NEZ45839.1 amidinotransferase [Clostridium niameyense]
MLEIFLNNQYDKLSYCLMCYPCNYKITDNNNPYKDHINFDLMFHQYNNFINILIDKNVKVQFLDQISDCPSQVYSRDIGFVIKDTFFMCKLKNKERMKESIIIECFLKKYNIKYHKMQNNIEGGDVILYNDVVFVGISSRTKIESCNELQRILEENNINVKVVPINFDNHKLHLDCVFNIIDKDTCIISNYVYDIDKIKQYIKNTIFINKETADNLGTNVIALGNKNIITSNKIVYNTLKDNGFNAIYSDYSEIIKGGGSFTCSTLPLLRS